MTSTPEQLHEVKRGMLDWAAKQGAIKRAQHGRSGISIDRALRLREKLKLRAGDIFSRAIMFKWSHEDIQEETIKLHASNEWKRSPGWVQSYLRGYIDARRDNIYRDNLMWVLSLDDKLVTSREVDTATKDEQELGITKCTSYRTPWQRVDGEKSRHVWKDSEGQPMLDKPYDAKWR
jgi:hypothetical protein